MAVNGGVKNWASGQVLDAEELNEFVADQTIARFATVADRTAAYGVSGAPALQKGLFSWVEATEKLYYYSGTAWVEVGAQIEAGEITNTEISATAAIALSKLASGTSAQVIVHNSSGVPTATTVTGDVTITNTGVTAISSGVIVNADVSASAAIALSKLASGTSGQVIVANSSGVPTWVSETGDVTISDTGVTAISSGVIVNADVSASAAIDYSKLASLTSGNILVGNASNVATSTAMSGDVTITNTGVTAISSGVIVNADINTSAAIALSKLASGTSAQVVLANSSGVPTYTSVTGDVTISNTGVTAISSGVIVNADVSASAAIELGKLADVTIDTKTANYTLALTDKNKIIETNITGSNNTVSVPTDASVNFPIGSQITITQYGTGRTQVIPVSAGTTFIRCTPTGGYLRAQYSSATLIKRAANEWYLIGDLSAS
jgi:sporulation protein YlmC with PRC-barrel domain